MLSAPQHASWRRLALRARRRWCGRSAPGACGEPDLGLRYALGARRTALRAEGAARLCAGRRSRWLPSPPRATRSAPMAWALRARAPAAAQSRPRAARSAPMARALRARAPACAPADNARVASWWWVGMLKTPCASRCSRRSMQCALRAPAEGEGGEGWSRDHHAQACGATLACERSMCSVSAEWARRASATGAPYPQARPTPRTLSARARLHAAGEGLMTVMTI